MNSNIIKFNKEYLQLQGEANEKADGGASEEELSAVHKRLDVAREKLILAMEDFEANPPPPKTPDGETKEIVKLFDEVSAARYIHLAVEDKGYDGAEKELNDALKFSGERSIPLALLMPREERIAALGGADEELADAITSIKTPTTHANTSPIAGLVLKQTAAARLGLTMPTVPPGMQRYPFLTAGPTVGVVDTGADRDAAAAAMSVVEISPYALQGSFIIDRDTIVRHGAELQTLLETELRRAMASQLDDEVLMGSGASPTRTKGLFPYVTGVTDASADDDLATTWAEARAVKAAFVDSQYFMEETPTRMLIGLDTYRYLEALFAPGGGGRIEPSEDALSIVRSKGVDVIVRDRGPASVAATSSKGKYQDAMYMGEVGASNIVTPVWDEVDLLTDIYSAHRKRQRIVTISVYMGIGYRRVTTAGTIPGVKKVRWYSAAKT